MFIASVGTGIARVGTATDTGLDVSAGTEETLVQGLNGNDRSGPNGISTASHFTIDGGNGDDTLGGGDGDDLLLGGPGNDLVDGNRGSTPPAWAPATTPSSGIRATATTPSKARAAPTRCSSTAPTPARRSTVSADGARVRFTRNVANIAMDLGTLERVNVRALGGVDNVTVNDLAGTRSSSSTSTRAASTATATPPRTT